MNRGNWTAARIAGAVCVIGALALPQACSPDAPGGGIPTHPSEGYSVTLAWDAPTLDAMGQPLSDLAGYTLYYSMSEPPSGPEGESVEVGLEASATLSGLPPGTYFFAVAAVDTAGNESEPSASLEVELGP